MAITTAEGLVVKGNKYKVNLLDGMAQSRAESKGHAAAHGTQFPIGRAYCALAHSSSPVSRRARMIVETRRLPITVFVEGTANGDLGLAPAPNGCTAVTVNTMQKRAWCVSSF